MFPVPGSGNGQDICSVPGHVTMMFPWPGTLQMSWPFPAPGTGNILNELLRKILGTFFGKILNVPMMFLMGTPWSHDLEHCECTSHFLTQEYCRETSWEHSEWTWDVLGGFLPGTLSMSLWCPCDVPAQDTTPCPQCKVLHWGCLALFANNPPRFGLGLADGRAQDSNSLWGQESKSIVFTFEWTHKHNYAWDQSCSHLDDKDTCQAKQVQQSHWT